MRPHAALLALPAALLVSTVIAVPSPAAYLQHQQPFSASTSAVPARSRWRTLSDRLITSIWRSTSSEKNAGSGGPRTDRQAPAHILAQYGGDVVLRFNLSTAAEARSLAEAADTLLLDVWEFTDDWVDIRLAKDIVQPLLGLLPRSLQHAHTPLLAGRDLAQAIYDTYPAPRHPSSSPPTTTPPSHLLPNDRPFSPALHHHQPTSESNLFFADYQPLSVVVPWLHLLASLFPTHVRALTLGTSAQGRPIPALRIGVHPSSSSPPTKYTHPGPNPPPKRKTLLITAGLHAREWISTSTASYLAYSLITSYGKVPAITQLLETLDVVVVPTLNVDGYAHTWSTDRLWRKNRQPTSSRFCAGIDLDRSFGYEWDGYVTTKGNPCSESYAGERAFEAVEAKALADWARNETERHGVEFVAFLDLHSYAQEIQYPFAYSCGVTPPGLENLEEVGMGMGKAIRVASGHNYRVMSACEGNLAPASSNTDDSRESADRPRGAWPRMEAAGGSALDYFSGALGVRYAYQVKLRDRGTYGFLLPRGEIVPTGREALAAVLHLGGFLTELYGAGGAGVVEEEEGKSRGEEGEKGTREGPRKEDDADAAESSRGEAVGDELDDDWVVVDADEEGELGEGVVQWELRRRRRR
ncbi:putative metallocarboxypeptidase ecm14 [Teratosphaeriaceae sp. CCFEE 6253]|nr:putative metallocarboxypeptidase ecm14 [Teratosphaeriaceae sp. CCFEE 6253]